MNTSSMGIEQISDNTRNILITGGCGFLGRHLVSLLREKGYNPVVLDNMDPLCGGKGKPDAYGDVRSLDFIVEVLGKNRIWGVLHLAAYGRNLTCKSYPVNAWNINTCGTQNVLEAAYCDPWVKRVVCCSSNIALSDVPTVYRASKRAVESLVEVYASQGVSCMALRPSNIHGSGQSKTEFQMCAFAGMDSTYLKTGHFFVSGNGTQSRDWVHAQDVARAFTLALESDVVGLALDVCTGRQTSMNEIAVMLDVPVEYTDPRPGDAKMLVSDPEPARRLLGFEARVGLEDSIWDSFPSVPRCGCTI